MSFSKRWNEWKHTDHKIPLIICSIFFGLYALSLLYPIAWILVKSFMDPEIFENYPEQFFPTSLYLGNYKTAMLEVADFKFIPMILNTTFLALVIPTIQIAACCCISYAYAKFRFKFRKLVFFIAICSMFIPSVGTLPVTYELMKNLGLMDSFLGYFLLTGGGMGFAFLLVSSQYENISKEYSEAAEMDGASKFRIFVQIITPQIIPTLTALWVLGFIGTWNDYAMQLLFLPTHKTLSVGIYNLYTVANSAGGALYPVLFAGIIMVEIPVLVIFFVFQKKILSFSLGGGIKS